MPCFKTPRKWLPFSRKVVTENPSHNQSYNGSAVHSGYPDSPDCNLALMNDVILQRLFQYLSSKDVKSCRLVCRKWEFNGEPTFKARFRLCFDSSLYHTLYSKKKALMGLKENFQNFLTKIPFTAVTVGGDLPWPPKKLTKFFELEGRFITDLTLDNVRLPYVNWGALVGCYKTFDFGTVIGGVWKLKRLQITYSDEDSDYDYDFHRGFKRLKLSLGNLCNIEVISLTNCEIELTQHILKPTSLKLSDIGFYDKNKFVENVLINEFVDFSDLSKELLLNSGIKVSDDRVSELTLDLQGNFKMEKLMIWGEVEIINSEQSTWTVDTVYFFRCILFQKMRKMNVRYFIMEDGECTLSFLPSSLTTLRVKDVKFHMENEHELWNLHLANAVGVIPAFLRNQPERLQLVYPFMPHFDTIFNNLTELHLMNGECIILRMEMQQLPQRLKKLFLRREEFKFSGDVVQSLDILSLKYVSLEFGEKMLDHFAPDNIVIFVKDLEASLSQQFLENLSQKSVRRIIVGIFACKGEPWGAHCLVPTQNTTLASPFPTIVQPEEFYAFINGKGGAIKCESYLEAKTHMENEQDD